MTEKAKKERWRLLLNLRIKRFSCILWLIADVTYQKEIAIKKQKYWIFEVASEEVNSFML